jgi:hypothetical protein
VKHGKHHDDIDLDGKVDGVGEAPDQRPTDPRADFLILQRTLDNPVIGSTQLVEELHPQPWPFVLVPLERRLDIEIGPRL